MDSVRYWIFKIPDWQQSLGENREFTFSFTQKRRFSGSRYDFSIVLDSDASGFYFSAIFVIEDVKLLPTTDNEGNIVYNHDVNFRVLERFQKLKPIDYYLYSIKRVRNWERPMNHFKLKYTEINQLEFEAITEDKVFLERTILGGVVNQLPSEHRESFMQLLMIEMPSVFFEIKDYKPVYDLLKRYLEYAIVNPSKMLVYSYSAMKGILPNQNLDDLSFGEVDDNFQVSSKSNIRGQVKLINNHLSGFLELLEMGGNARTQEDKLFKDFNNLFNGTNMAHLIKKI